MFLSELKRSLVSFFSCFQNEDLLRTLQAATPTPRPSAPQLHREVSLEQEAMDQRGPNLFFKYFYFSFWAWLILPP